MLNIPPHIYDGQTWGPWTYHSPSQTLSFTVTKETNYHAYLSRLNTPRDILCQIFKIAREPWGTDYTVGRFVAAIDAFFAPASE